MSSNIDNPVHPVLPSKKLAAQFSKAAKDKALTTLLRNAYGGSFSRKDLKEFEQKNNVVVQWVARREDPVQNFRTPLGFVRVGRGTFAIPADSNSISDAVKTVTEVPGGPGRDVEVLVNEDGVPVTVVAGDGSGDADGDGSGPIGVEV